MTDVVEFEQVALPAVANPTPSHLLQMAVQQGADLDKLERLMALQERWEATEARKAYDTAFAALTPPISASPTTLCSQRATSSAWCRAG